MSSISAPRKNTPFRKAKIPSGYAMIPKMAVFNTVLSLEAKGLLCYLLCTQMDMHTTFNHVSYRLGIGEDKLMSLIQELTKAGYCEFVICDNGNTYFEVRERVIQKEKSK